MTISCKKRIKGTYFPPGDKSISHRILILTGQAVGKSKISNLLEGEDVLNTLKVMKILGANIKKKMENIKFLEFLQAHYLSPLNHLILEILERE